MTELNSLKIRNGKPKKVSKLIQKINKFLKIKPIRFKRLDKMAHTINYIEYFSEKAEKYPEITIFKDINQKLIKNFEHLINKYLK